MKISLLSAFSKEGFLPDLACTYNPVIYSQHRRTRNRLVWRYGWMPIGGDALTVSVLEFSRTRGDRKIGRYLMILGVVQLY